MSSQPTDADLTNDVIQPAQVNNPPRRTTTVGEETSEAKTAPAKNKVKAHCPICRHTLRLTEKEAGLNRHIYQNHIRLWDPTLSVEEMGRRARGREALAGDTACPFCRKHLTPVGLRTHIRIKHRRFWGPSLTVGQMRRSASYYRRF